MIVFGIDCNFLIVLPIALKTCRSMVFFFFTRQKERARNIGRLSEVLLARARPIGIGRTICPGLLVLEKRQTYTFSLLRLGEKKPDHDLFSLLLI